MKNMKMKLLDYTLMGLLAGMAAAQAQAQEATSPAPASPQLDCTGDACTSDEGLLFKLRTRSYDVPVTEGTNERSGSQVLQPDRRVSIGLLEPGKAVFRRSQLLDAVLYRDKLPPLFMLLSEQEQLLAGNAFMRHLAQQMNPSNLALGQREVIRLMDAGERLSEYLDLNLATQLPTVRHTAAFLPGHPNLEWN